MSRERKSMSFEPTWKSNPAQKQFIEWGLQHLYGMTDPDHIERFIFSLLFSVLNSECESLYEPIYDHLPRDYKNSLTLEKFKEYIEDCDSEIQSVIEMDESKYRGEDFDDESDESDGKSQDEDWGN